MNTTGDQNIKKNDPKDYPKNGDIVLPPFSEIKKRAANLMALKTPAGEKKAVFDIPSIDPDDRANKFWVLKALGFVPRGPARWWHPVLGEDFEHNHLLFDVETDDLKSLTPKLYRTGWFYGQRNIRMQLKKTLDL